MKKYHREFAELVYETGSILLGDSSGTLVKSINRSTGYTRYYIDMNSAKKKNGIITLEKYEN
jgi:hypothetical protein